MEDITSDPDARAMAFEALLPLAAPTSTALDRVQAAVDDEQKLTEPIRERWHTTQKAASAGYGRFCHGVLEFTDAVRHLPGMRRISSEIEEAQNIYRWQLGRYVIRLKHELEGVAPGTLKLWAELPPEDRPVEVFLTWDINTEGKIVRPAFVTIDEPKWNIPLAQLLTHAAPSVASIMPARDGAKVRSTRLPSIRKTEAQE